MAIIDVALNAACADQTICEYVVVAYLHMQNVGTRDVKLGLF